SSAARHASVTIVLLSFMFLLRTGSAPEHAERDSRALEPLDQWAAHGRRWRDDTRELRCALALEGEAQRGLREHLRGLGVARIAAGDLRQEGAPAGAGQERDAKPRTRALLLARPFAPVLHLQEQRAGGRELREREEG